MSPQMRNTPAKTYETAEGVEQKRPSACHEIVRRLSALKHILARKSILKLFVGESRHFSDTNPSGSSGSAQRRNHRLRPWAQPPDQATSENEAYGDQLRSRHGSAKH
jgi:hypothetical protein